MDSDEQSLDIQGQLYVLILMVHHLIMQRRLEDLVGSGEYNSELFTVVLQPFFSKTELPETVRTMKLSTVLIHSLWVLRKLPLLHCSSFLVLFAVHPPDDVTMIDTEQ